MKRAAEGEPQHLGIRLGARNAERIREREIGERENAEPTFGSGWNRVGVAGCEPDPAEILSAVTRPAGAAETRRPALERRQKALPIPVGHGVVSFERGHEDRPTLGGQMLIAEKLPLRRPALLGRRSQALAPRRSHDASGGRDERRAGRVLVLNGRAAVRAGRGTTDTHVAPDLAIRFVAAGIVLRGHEQLRGGDADRTVRPEGRCVAEADRAAVEDLERILEVAVPPRPWPPSRAALHRSVRRESRGRPRSRRSG